MWKIFLIFHRIYKIIILNKFEIKIYKVTLLTSITSIGHYCQLGSIPYTVQWISNLCLAKYRPVDPLSNCTRKWPLVQRSRKCSNNKFFPLKTLHYPFTKRIHIINLCMINTFIIYIYTKIIFRRTPYITYINAIRISIKRTTLITHKFITLIYLYIIL